MTATRSRSRRKNNNSDRFAERRHEIRQRQGARRLKWVAGLAALALLAVGVIALLNSGAFAVDNVTVDGVDRESAEQVYRASRLEAGQPLVDVNKEEVALAVEELPWVRSAVVDRAWSGTVTISVESRTTLFALAVSDGSGFVGVDRDGVQIARLTADAVVDSGPQAQGSDGASGVPLVHGLAIDLDPGAVAPPEAALAINYHVSVPDHIRSLVTKTEIVGQSLRLHLTSGGIAELGDSRQLGAKFQALETILNQVELACLGTVDVSVPTAPSVTRTCQPSDEAGQDG